MKRSAYLKHFSRDHHLALSLGKLCLRAVDSGDKELVSATCKRVALAFSNELEPHFRAEEQDLFPRMQQAGSFELVDRALNEHASLRVLMEKINSEIDLAAMAAFGNLLIGHVRFEERELFNVAEKILNLDAD